MPVRRSYAVALAGILAWSGVSSAQDDPLITVSTRAAQQPLVLPGGTPLGDELPPLLSVTPTAPDTPPAGTGVPAVPCRTNPYYQGHAYLPETNPDGRAGMCENAHRGATRLWFTAAAFVGLTEDMGNVKREETFGFRLGAGYWFDDYRTLGVDLSFLNTHDTYSVISNVPSWVNAPLTFTTGDVNLRAHLIDYDRYRLDGLVGYRVLQLGERFNSASANQIVIADSKNVVHAAQIGAVGDYHFGPYFGELAFKLGVGSNQQRSTINALTTRTNSVVFVPEVQFRVGYLLGAGVRTYAGYNFYYLSEATRANNLTPNNFSLNAFIAGVEFVY